MFTISTWASEPIVILHVSASAGLPGCGKILEQTVSASHHSIEVGPPLFRHACTCSPELAVKAHIIAFERWDEADATWRRRNPYPQADFYGRGYCEEPSEGPPRIRRVHAGDLGGISRDTAGNRRPGPFQFNDVDPLPAAIADRLDGFDAGDLLVSARSLNLLFVLDPDTLEVR